MVGSDDSAAPVPRPGSHDVLGTATAERTDDRAALDRLFETVYDELHALAGHQLAGRSAGATLSNTVLVHETYLELVGSARVDCRDRHHFFALASYYVTFPELHEALGHAFHAAGHTHRAGA